MPLDQEVSEPKEKEMSFLEHLEELRWHIIRAVSAILFMSLVAFVFKDFFFGVIVLGPAKTDFVTYRFLCWMDNYLKAGGKICIDKLNFVLQSRQMSGQFAMHITYSFIAGLVMSFPYAFWEAWRFVRPGLYDNEISVTRGAVFWVSFLFFLGILFGYYVASPLSVNFLANYTLDPTIQNQFDITSYIETVSMLVLACGIMFQLPMVVLVLTKIGLITPAFMKTYRRHAIIVILVIAAIITPPDVFSQLLVTTPLIVLYEAGIYLSAWEIKKQKQRGEA